MDPASPGREFLDGLHFSERLLNMHRAIGRTLLGVVLLTGSSATMGQMVHHRKATSVIQLFLVAAAPAKAPRVCNVNIDDAPTLAANLLGVRPDQARAIVSYRKRHGKFESILDLLEVEELGRQLIVRNRRLIAF